MSRFAGIAYDGIRDAAARQAFRRLSEVMGNMFLTGAAADRPSSARLGAFYVCQDGDNQVYWYAGPAIGWLQIHSDNSSGVPSVLHEKLSDLLGGAASDHYHITGAEHTALLSNYPWGAGGVIYVGSGPVLAVDASNFLWDATTGTLCVGTTDSIGSQSVLHAVREGMNYLTLTTYTSDHIFWRSAFRFRRAGGSEESPTAIGSGYWIGQLRGEGHDGSGFQAAGGIRLIADPSGANWTGSDRGAYWSFYGVKPATTSQIELLRLRNGQVQLPGGSASLPALAWWNSAGMGFYRLADNEIGVTLSAAKNFWLRGTGVLGQTA